MNQKEYRAIVEGIRRVAIPRAYKEELASSIAESLQQIIPIDTHNFVQDTMFWGDEEKRKELVIVVQDKVITGVLNMPDGYFYRVDGTNFVESARDRERLRKESERADYYEQIAQTMRRAGMITMQNPSSINPSTLTRPF